ncbi:hypothetical protein DdX_21317 [Ditylenchus destructor]|uniref:Uncharacterized protein n=1 Tax=Ditylenchus destructor TaxID=166010 RepID=A0AAD4MHH9_9BILA|nr:hypothetical protein DdX_21317 [Ditylenchus destructor]
MRPSIYCASNPGPKARIKSSALFSSGHEHNHPSNYDANCLLLARLQQPLVSDIIKVDNDAIIGSQLTSQAKQLATYQLFTGSMQYFAKNASIVNIDNQQLGFMHDSYLNPLSSCNKNPETENILSTLDLNYMPNLLTYSQFGADVCRNQVYSSTDIDMGNTLYPTYSNGNTDVGDDSGKSTDMANLDGRCFTQQCNSHLQAGISPLIFALTAAKNHLSVTVVIMLVHTEAILIATSGFILGRSRTSAVNVHMQVLIAAAYEHT